LTVYRSTAYADARRGSKPAAMCCSWLHFATCFQVHRSLFPPWGDNAARRKKHCGRRIKFFMFPSEPQPSALLYLAATVATIHLARPTTQAFSSIVTQYNGIRSNSRWTDSQAACLPQLSSCPLFGGLEDRDMDEETISDIKGIDLALLDIVRLTTDTVDTLCVAVRMLTGLSLPPAALHILREVRETTPTLKQLVASVELSQPTVSVHIRELEKKGLVTRSPHPSDGRATIIRITPEGEWIVDMVETSRETHCEEVFHDWEKADIVSLARLLDRFRSDKRRCVLLNRQRQAEPVNLNETVHIRD